VPKDEFVEVNLELRLAHAVMGADQPLLEIADGPISKGHNGLLALAQFQTEGLVARDMLEANLRQTREAFETVRVDGGTKCDVPSKKRYYRAGLEVSNYAHASSTGSPTALLHCYQDEGSSPILELSATAKTRLFAANPRVINLHFAA
jgi:hypothetical protein